MPTETRATEPPPPSRRSRAWFLAPAGVIWAMDLALRGGRIAAFPFKYWLSYLAGIFISGVFWGLLLYAAAPRRGSLRHLSAGIFVVLATLALGVQLYFHRQYATYLNLDATLFGTSMTDSLLGQLEADGANFLQAIAPAAAAAIGAVMLARRHLSVAARQARLCSLATPALLAAMLLIPVSYRGVQASPPDALYFHAIGGLAKQRVGWSKKGHVRPKRRTPPSLVQTAPQRPRNVVLILTESLRFDDVCTEVTGPTEGCVTTPFTNAAVPDRFPLLQMRSNSSTTAIQLAVLWSGLEPNASRDALHAAPLLFDYAHAAGLATAYWTSHHMMFANSRLFVQDLPLDHHCSATLLDPEADIDMGADDRLLTAHVKAKMGQLTEPFFAVIHYGNTHVPYLVDDDDAPIQPAKASKANADNDDYHRYYQNAVYRQDRTIAEMVKAIRARPFGDRTVIVYTSDHGEQFREHHQLGHTGSVFDVEVRVPTWLDAPPNTLSDHETERLRASQNTFLFHTDLTRSLLTLMGLGREANFRAHYRSMIGTDFLREPPDTNRITTLTNCSGVWGCAFENWGAIGGHHKVIAREWDKDWLCFDVLKDPQELSPSSDPECRRLRAHAEATFMRLPGR